jgi:hypothetical protein
MAAELHIVASCAKRKRLPIPEALQLRGVEAPDIEECAYQWWRRLQAHPAAPVPAQALYAGDHWRIVQELPGVASGSGFSARLWVASAGYGFIPAEAAIHAYSATFTAGQPDCVSLKCPGAPARQLHQRWWKALARQPHRSLGPVRQVAQLAVSSRDASILVIASPSYVAALEEDLLLAARALRHPERLVIISAPCALARGPLSAHWVSSSSRLQAQLGGTLASLNIRMARHALQQARGNLDARKLQGYYGRLIHRSAPPTRYERTPMTDDEVRDFIAHALRTEPLSWSAALRRLRDGGHSCEQGRFRRIFSELQART